MEKFNTRKRCGFCAAKSDARYTHRHKSAGMSRSISRLRESIDGIVPSSADRIYRGAINKLRKALEEKKWL